MPPEAYKKPPFKSWLYNLSLAAYAALTQLDSFVRAIQAVMSLAAKLLQPACLHHSIRVGMSSAGLIRFVKAINIS